MRVDEFAAGTPLLLQASPWKDKRDLPPFSDGVKPGPIHLLRRFGRRPSQAVTSLMISSKGSASKLLQRSNASLSSP